MSKISFYLLLLFICQLTVLWVSCVFWILFLKVLSFTSGFHLVLLPHLSRTDSYRLRPFPVSLHVLPSLCVTSFVLWYCINISLKPTKNVTRLSSLKLHFWFFNFKLYFTPKKHVFIHKVDLKKTNHTIVYLLPRVQLSSR